MRQQVAPVKGNGVSNHSAPRDFFDTTRPAVSMIEKEAKRMAELTQWFEFVYGGTFPDDDAGREDIKIACHHMAQRRRGARDRILSYLKENAPWMSEAEAKNLADKVIAKPCKYQADTLAELLGVTDAKRTEFGFTTIGAIDVTKAERAERRKERWRTNSAKLRVRQRIAKGGPTRAEYEAKSASKAKPWESMGMSRRTWYRKGKPMAQVPSTAYISPNYGVNGTCANTNASNKLAA